MSSIRKSLTSGIFYTAIAKYSNIFFSIVIGAVLSRLLTPKEFGIVALVTVFVTFFNLLGNFGIGQAVVQNQNLTKHDIRSIFSFSIIFSFLLSFLFFMAAPLISRFYGESELINITKFLSLAVLFNTLQQIPRGLLEKELRFKKIGLITVTIQLINGIIAIYLAYKDFSYYALVIRSISNGFLLFVIFYMLAPIRIVLKIDFKSIEKVIKFSVFNFSFNFVNYFTRNGDNLIIGKFLGSTSLGFYSKAYQLMMLPVQNLTHVVTPVMMPVFAKYQDDKTVIYRTYLNVVRILATIGFPLSVFLFFSAYEIINIMYGSQWDASIPVFKILSLIIGVQMIYSSAGSVFLAIDRAQLLFYYGLISSLILITGIFSGIVIGSNIESVGIGIVIAFIINFLVVFWMLIRIALKKSYLQFVKTLGFPLLISFIMVLPLWIYTRYENDNIVLSLLVKIFIAGITFSLLFMSKKENRRALKNTLKR